MKKILITLLLVFFAATSAQAFTIEFDSTGSGDDTNLETMNEWNLLNTPEYNADADANGDIWTYQDSATGDFSEDFTLRLTGGAWDTEGIIYTFNNLAVDIHLDGNYVDDSEINFTGGSAIVYADDGDYDYEVGEIIIAELSYSSSLISNLSGGLQSEVGLQMLVDIEFLFDDVNPDYFGDTEESLVDKSWLISFVGTDIAQEQLINLDGTPDLLIEWDTQGAQVEFGAIPEPTTILLFGFGLLGIAGMSRKKRR